MEKHYQEYHQIIDLFSHGQLMDEAVPQFVSDQPSSPSYQRDLRLRAAFISVLNEEATELHIIESLN